MSRPRIAITIGDVAGIGPEVSVRAAVSPEILSICRPALIGDAQVVRRAVQLVDPSATVVECGSLSEAVESGSFETVTVWNPLKEPLGDIPPGRTSGRCRSCGL